MSIPTEYYEPEFIEFEEFMNVLGNTKESTSQNPHATGDYMLEMFKYFEFFRDSEKPETGVNRGNVKLKSEKKEKMTKKCKVAHKPKKDARERVSFWSKFRSQYLSSNHNIQYLTYLPVNLSHSCYCRLCQTGSLISKQIR